MDTPEIQSDLIDSLETESIIEHLQAERDYDDATRGDETICPICAGGKSPKLPACDNCLGDEIAHYAQRDCERNEREETFADERGSMADQDSFWD